jgi:hypothetical protein
VAASYYLSPLASFLQVLNDAGQLQPGLLIWTSAAGTSTPTNTWTDITGTVLNSNPIQLNSAGRLQNVSIWQQGGVPIKVQFSSNAGTVLAPVFGQQLGPTFDQVSGINDPVATLANLANPATGFGVDLVANAVKSYDIFSSVRAAQVPSLVAGETLIVGTEGATSAGDGLGGFFYWVASSTATDNGLTVLKPNALGSGSPGRYLSILSALNGSFTATTTDAAGTTTGTVYYSQSGFEVTLSNTTGFGGGASSSVIFVLSGLPASLSPAHQQLGPIFGAAQDNSTACGTQPQINASGTNIVWNKVTPTTLATGSPWTASGNKAIPGFSFTYLLS